MGKTRHHGWRIVRSLVARSLAICLMPDAVASAKGAVAAEDPWQGPCPTGLPRVVAFDQYGRPLGRHDELGNGNREPFKRRSGVQTPSFIRWAGTLDAYWLDAAESRWLVIRSGDDGSEAALVCTATEGFPTQWVPLDPDWGDSSVLEGVDPPLFLFDVNQDGTFEVFLSTSWRGARPCAWGSSLTVLMFDDDGKPQLAADFVLHEWSLVDIDHDGFFEFEAVEHATVDVPSLQMVAEVAATRILAFQNGRIADTRRRYAQQSYRRFVFGELAGERRLGDRLPMIELMPFTTNFANVELEEAGGLEVHPPDLATIAGLASFPATLPDKETPPTSPSRKPRR